MSNEQKNGKSQLDLFSDVVPNDEPFITPVRSAPAKVEAVAVEAVVEKAPVVEAVKEIQTPVVDKVEENLPEIAGQVKTDIYNFVSDISYETRFVSLAFDSDVVIITPYSEDNSITLKDIKELYPSFVTQLQKVTGEKILDASDNMNFIEKLQTIIDSKKLNMAVALKAKEVKELDSFIDEQVHLISELERGEFDLSDDLPEVEVDSVVEVSSAPRSGAIRAEHKKTKNKPKM